MSKKGFRHKSIWSGAIHPVESSADLRISDYTQREDSI